MAGTLGQGGAERQLYCILRLLRDAGAVPHLLTLTQGEFWESRISEIGIPIEFLGTSPSRLARALKVARAVRHLRPHLVQSQHFFANCYVGLAGRMGRVPSVGAVRNDGRSELKALGGFIGASALYLPSRVAANSRTAIATLVQWGYRRSRFAYLPNVVEVPSPSPRSERPRERPFTILSVGRLAPQKRLDRAFSIARSVATDLPASMRFLILGDGPLRPQVEAWAVETRRNRLQVDVIGATSDPFPYYGDADALLMTSDYEGTPNVILEAMAAGLPVVASAVGGIPELLEHARTGFLFPPDNLALPVEFLRRLFNDQGLGLQIGAAARMHVANNYSPQELLHALESLYWVLSSRYRPQ